MQIGTVRLRMMSADMVRLLTKRQDESVGGERGHDISFGTKQKHFRNTGKQKAVHAPHSSTD